MLWGPGNLKCDMINKHTLKIGFNNNYRRRLGEVFVSQNHDDYRAGARLVLVAHVHDPDDITETGKGLHRVSNTLASR